MTIGTKLRKLRQKKDFTQDYVAEKLHITRQAYGKIENGETKLSIENFCKIAEILSITTLEEINDLLDVPTITNSIVNSSHNQNLHISEEIMIVYKKLNQRLEHENTALKHEITALKYEITQLQPKKS
jgi:transcriptional regulator with XRE-family HTH domain